MLLSKSFNLSKKYIYYQRKNIQYYILQEIDNVNKIIYIELLNKKYKITQGYNNTN